MSWEIVVPATSSDPAKRLRINDPTPRKILRVVGLIIGDLWLCYADLIVDLDAKLNPEVCFSGAWWYGCSPEHGGKTEPLFLVKAPVDFAPYLDLWSAEGHKLSMFI